MNKKKKLNINSLPDYATYRDNYYKQHPEDIPLLEKEIIESFAKEDVSVEVLIASLKEVARLYGIAELSKATDLNREHLYKALSPKGNPTIKTVSKIANALGYRLTFTPL